jgi:hypothetical protein
VNNIALGLFATFFASLANITAAEERLYGSFVYNSEIPNALFWCCQIKLA